MSNKTIGQWIDFLKEEDFFVENGMIKDYSYIISWNRSKTGYNGYIVFPKRPLKEKGYNGIATYVPVHGGITFTKQYKDGFVYGFDTAHYDSHKFPRASVEWIKNEIAIMLEGILIAQKVEKKYLLAESNEEKLKYIKMLLKVNDEGNLNSGMMLNILFGQL